MFISAEVNSTVSQWIESIFNKWFGNEDNVSNLSYGAILVVSEMTLTLVGIVLNLIVIISIREKESLLNSTLNIILGNLCFSNLMAAVFVKSIAIIYNGYAVASEKWSVELAFCTIHTLSARATWAVLPYSIIVLNWLFVINRATKIFCNIFPEWFFKKGRADNDQNHIESFELEVTRKEGDNKSELEEIEKEEEDYEVEEYSGIDGLGVIQKSILGFIWFVSFVYSLLSPQIFGKTSNSCVLRDPLDSKLNILSLIIIIPIPIFFGPVICSLAQILLSFVECIIRSKCISTNELPSMNDHNCLNYSKITYFLTFLITLIFILEYPISMFFVEEYIGKRETIFVFMLLKYVLGYMHIVIIPLFIIIMRKDIFNAANSVLSQKSIANQQEDDITFEQFQTHCGMGVNPT
ncbi:uncharacterized protein [Lepeophtheirus salmonis]|nr:uncharacterized protein LOC121128666 [Lepeophtheirus salmonis]XP_040580189.1 uncharacterized protein LOC121128666 [Lepeophtheirus salmonis]